MPRFVFCKTKINPGQNALMHIHIDNSTFSFMATSVARRSPHTIIACVPMHARVPSVHVSNGPNHNCILRGQNSILYCSTVQLYAVQ